MDIHEELARANAVAKMFGSYLECWGKHHSWCNRTAQATADCNCGFESVIREVADFHEGKVPQIASDHIGGKIPGTDHFFDHCWCNPRAEKVHAS